ncbi:MAG: prolyl oligopeptidase family serine peptidase [Pirellulales bacterium]
MPPPIPILVAVLLLGAPPASFAPPAVLPGTAVLDLQEPLDERLLKGIQAYCDRRTADAPRRRSDAWNASRVGEKRARLAALLGATDARVTATDAAARSFERLASVDRDGVVARSADGRIEVVAVRWPVLEGVAAEGLMVRPQQAEAVVIAIPDASKTPEQVCGLTAGADAEARGIYEWARAGCIVVVPAVVSLRTELSGHPRVGYTNQTHREFLYRQTYEVGRHPLGYEVQMVLAAVDIATQAADGSSYSSVAVAGVGEGGATALCAAALDDRVTACLTSGYFGPRESLASEPVYRNVWRRLVEFGDAEIAALLAPRGLTVEGCAVDEYRGPAPAVSEQVRKSSAPGIVASRSSEEVQREWARVEQYRKQLGDAWEARLVWSGERGDGPAWSNAAVAALRRQLQLTGTAESTVAADSGPAKRSGRPVWDLVGVSESRLKEAGLRRERRQFAALQEHVQRLARESSRVRDARWRPAAATREAWEAERPKLQAWVHDELIGRLPLDRIQPLAVRTRLTSTHDDYVVYEVLLDVVDGVQAGGRLLVPRTLKEGERRAAVVCQHGLESLAADTYSHERRPFGYYKAFAETLVRRGYVVYAPQNPYRGGDRFRQIQRSANPLGLSLFSFIAAQHERTLDWLAALPMVDGNRIAFYGLSYGGKTAMRVPPLVDRYCLAICSGDFTDWVRVITTNDEPYGYAFTGEYEIPEWNLAHVASYAELAMLMSPRPFMVEQGHRDGGSPTEWTAAEFGKVRRHYDQLGWPARAVCEFFDGPHTIHAQEALKFLPSP